MTFSDKHTSNADDRPSLRVFTSNSYEGAPETVLVFEGFSGPDEIKRFLDMLFLSGILQIEPKGLN